MKKYDVIIIGAGHAGVEAANVLNNQKIKTALVTFKKSDISYLFCNVSIGGSAKGIVVKELYALGGLMPIVADSTQLQTKILNKSKGSAVQALRAQVDKIDYPKVMQDKILNMQYLDLIEDEVINLSFDQKGILNGVNTKKNKHIFANYVIITTGTFLDSKIMQGTNIYRSGPNNLKTTSGVSEQFKKFNLELLRLKTGTPPRVFKDSIDFSKLKIEPGSDDPLYFSEERLIVKKYQNIPAWILYTNQKTHQIIKDNLNKSYLYSEEITGIGPRYCPSIEDKIKRFYQKDRHQVFLELESEKLDTIYLSGLSSSLPKDVQDKFLKTLPGFENVKVAKHAYAIEYDSLNPIQLKQTFELKKIPHLFTAGQINGTSGYEEAAGQGLIAAINVANKIKKRPEFILDRNEAYIGVMVDDLTSKGIYDPYRLLSSRAEYRLLLRSDNAIRRLYKKSYKNKLITEDTYKLWDAKIKLIDNLILKIKELKLNQSDKNVSNLLKSKKIVINQNTFSLLNLLKRPEISIFDLENILVNKLKKYQQLTIEEKKHLEIEIKFEGYIKKQEIEVKKYLKYQNLKIKENFDYQKILNLSKEAKEKLINFKPSTIHQAKNISGISPSDIIILMNHINKKK
ncbi:MAG: tRNA uridine 5-carboxymethylaminomethyl modification protein GidA [Candidatus Hepatoplasma scabrum]|nr:MAG: tRNA uridine 5-carboxymethylaminomethyl modification protein GidA [Candidatus Hepatoplasma sp.]